MLRNLLSRRLVCRGSDVAAGEHDSGFLLPGTVQISPEIEADERDRMRLKTLGELHVQCVGRRSRRLVLNRDVWLPFAHVLRVQPMNESLCKPRADVVKLGARYREGNACAEMAKTGNLCPDFRGFFRDLGKVPDNCLGIFAGQAMKHRQMRMQEVSIWRKVSLTQAIERFEVGV